MARPTKLTVEVQEKIVGYLRQGNYLETAAAAVGIDRTTLRDWQRRGERAAAAGKRGKYRAFSLAVEKARAEAEIMGLGVITRAGAPRQVLDVLSKDQVAALAPEVRAALGRLQIPGEWTAMAWRLERTMPKKFGRRVEVTGEDGAPLVPPGRLGPEEIAAAVAAVLAGVPLELPGDERPDRP